MTNETEYRRANERTSPGEVARRLTAAERRRFRSRYFRFRTVACDDLGVDLFTSEPAASVDAGDMQIKPPAIVAASRAVAAD